MSNKHTPTPWELCDRGDYTDFDGDSRVILGDIDDVPRRIAVVQTDGREESEANARLMAAAPEMLIALEGVCAYLEKESIACSDIDLFNKINSALNLARGE